MKSASPKWSPASLVRLAEISAQHPDLSPYLTREMALRARRYMNGVALYRAHPAHRGPEKGRVVWQKGTTCLRDFAPHAAASAPVILVVPSLVNHYAILDLQPHHSLLRLLASHGMNALIVDWGNPGQEEKGFSLGDYVTQRLLPMLDRFDRPVHVLGYCMGGLLALAAAALRPGKTRSLSLLATPWDFHAGYDALDEAGRDLEEKLSPWLSRDEPLPVDVIQSIFAAFQPMQAFRKFSSFAALDQSGDDAARFVLTEDWLNDGVPIPIRAARECFGDFCSRNVAVRGEWQVGGQTVDPRRIAVPAYVVVPGRDRIVPPESAMPLAHALPYAVRHEPMMGHIGIMASAHAPHQVWKPLAQWLEMH